MILRKKQNGESPKKSEEREHKLKPWYSHTKDGHCDIYAPLFERKRTKAFGMPIITPFRWLFEKCCVEHPSISIELRVLGGVPHIKNTRLSVGQVLGRLYVLGSIKAVAEYYSPYISEEKIKEAIAYAQDFMELAGDPYQTDD